MKTNKILGILALSGTMALTSCGVAGGAAGTLGQTVLSNMVAGQTQTTQTQGTGLLGNLLSAFLGGGKVSQTDIVGTWTYQGAACVFESENLLARVGGAVAASKLEEQMDSKLAAVGIKAGSSTFTFGKDNTYSAVVAGREISGQYQLDPATNKITMTYLMGIGHLNATVGKSAQGITLLFEADKLLTLTNAIAKISGNNSTSNSISSLLSNYNGMQIGLKLAK